MAGCTTSTAHGPSASPSTTAATATTQPPLEQYLNAFGATTSAWDNNHTVDPDQTGFWPRLDNGEDTYANVRVSSGRIVGYVENFDPPVTAQQAKALAMNELPTDAHVVVDAPSANCEQLVLASPTLRAVLHADVLAQLSSGGPYDAAAVSSITYSTIAPGTSSGSLPAC